MPSGPLARIFTDIEHDALHAIANGLLDQGLSPDDVAQHIADIVAMSTAPELALIPGVGPVLAALDQPVARMIAKGIVRAVQKKRNG